MFTGIVEEIGRIHSFNNEELIVECNKIIENSNIGDSISTSGICLTITKIENNRLSFQISEETMNKTFFSKEQKITHVNLERSATLDKRVGGHLVEGHVEDTAICRKLKELKDSTIATFEADSKIIESIIVKGFVAIDGTSLTVNEIYNNLFKVSFIPHTLKHTTFNNLNINQFVNIETDVNARYIKKYVKDIMKKNNEL